jgi:hypothetical protein
MEITRLRSQGMMIPIHIADPAAAISLVGALQLACRHPCFSVPSRMLMSDIVESVQAQFAEANSTALVELIQRGWDPEHDVRKGDTGGALDQISP